MHKSIDNDHSPGVLSGSNNKGDVMNHVIKQINSLKLENLELKKMIGEKLKNPNQGRSGQIKSCHSVRSQSILSKYSTRKLELESIKSSRSKVSSKKSAPKKKKVSSSFTPNNCRYS